MIPANCPWCGTAYTAGPTRTGQNWVLRCPSCGTDGQLPMILHYQLLRRLGAGGFGEVYHAWDMSLAREVAIKFISPRLSGDERARKRLLREARAAAPLRHPNICPVYAISEQTDPPFIVMAHIEGQTLKDWIKLHVNTPENLSECLDISIQVIEGIAAAHAAGVVHRDVKPQNVMITSAGEAIVMDFGLARILPEASTSDDEAEPESPLSEDGVVLGTWAYMSPEQIEGQAVDHRSDIFSFGIVLYEMITGIHPFLSLSPGVTMRAIVGTDPVTPKSRLPWIPDELEAIMLGALRKNVDERYQTAEQLSDALLELDIEPATVVGPAPPAVEKKPDRSPVIVKDEIKTAPIKRKTMWTVLAIGLFLLILALIAIGLVRHKSVRSSKPSVAVLPLTDLSGDPALDYLSDALAEGIINNLSQFPDVKVIAWPTMSQYKGKETSPQELGNRLNINTVLAGKIMQEGDKLLLQITAVASFDGARLWGKTYDMSELQSRQAIPKRIAEELHASLTGQERALGPSRYTDNKDAYNAYLRGRFYWNKRNALGLKEAVKYFQYAMKLDPDYAPAYAGEADCLNLLSTFTNTPPSMSFKQAQEAAVKAIELDDQLPEAHASLAFALYRYKWDLKGAEKEFQLAIKLNPNYATAHHWYAEFLLPMGSTDDAIHEMERARELDPLSLIINADLGATYLLARRTDQAIDQLKDTIKLEERFEYAHGILGQAYEQKGMYDDALAEFKKEQEASGDRIGVLPSFGRVYALSGARQKALNVADELEKASRKSYTPPFPMVLLYVALGDKTKAFDWLGKAYEERSDRLIWLNVDPRLEGLRADPRFADLARRVGLVP